jgi:hypothetical protein
LDIQVGSIPSLIELTIPDTAEPAEIANIQAYLGNIVNSDVVKEMILTASPAI